MDAHNLYACLQSLCMLKYALVKHQFLEAECHGEDLCPLFPRPDHGVSMLFSDALKQRADAQRALRR